MTPGALADVGREVTLQEVERDSAMVAELLDYLRWLAERDDRNWAYRVGKARAGRLLDGREWNEVPA